MTVMAMRIVKCLFWASLLFRMPSARSYSTLLKNQSDNLELYENLEKIHGEFDVHLLQPLQDVIDLFSGGKSRNDDLKSKSSSSETNISETNLSETNISETNISETNISETNISETNNSETNNSEANISETNISDKNISDDNISERNISQPHIVFILVDDLGEKEFSFACYKIFNSMF
jgi:uncharacterized protein YjbI with pentapeptide repeats